MFPVRSIAGVAFIMSIIVNFSCKVWDFFLFKVFAKLLLVSKNFFSKKSEVKYEVCLQYLKSQSQLFYRAHSLLGKASTLDRLLGLEVLSNSRTLATLGLCSQDSVCHPDWQLWPWWWHRQSGSANITTCHFSYFLIFWTSYLLIGLHCI